MISSGSTSKEGEKPRGVPYVMLSLHIKRRGCRAYGGRWKSADQPKEGRGNHVVTDAGRMYVKTNVPSLHNDGDTVHVESI